MKKLLLQRKNVGTIDFGNGEIRISDPCYSLDVWCQIDNVHVLPGNYRCYAYEGRHKDWGNRIWINQIVSADPVAESFVEERLHDKNAWEEIGSIGVDAGLAGFIASGVDFSDDEIWDDLCRSMHDDDGPFHLKTSVEDAYILDQGNQKAFFTSSGLGDGVYDVYAMKMNDMIVALEIRF